MFHISQPKRLTPGPPIGPKNPSTTELLVDLVGEAQPKGGDEVQPKGGGCWRVEHIGEARNYYVWEEFFG